MQQGEEDYCEAQYQRETGKPVPKEFRPRDYDPYPLEEEEDETPTIHNCEDCDRG